MKKTLFSRSNSVILLILLFATLFVYLNQFTGKTSSSISNELQYQVFVELPRENFRRVILDQFPIKYSFVDKHENIFFKIKSNNEDLEWAKNVKISIWTKNRNSFEIRQYPEPVDKYLKKVGPLEHGYLKYDVLSDLVDGELTYVLVSIPGEKIEIEKIQVRFLTTPIANGGFTRKNFAALILLIAVAFPIYWFLRPKEVVSQWFLIGLSAFILFAVDYQFALLLIILLFLFYGSRNFLIRESPAKGKFLTICLILSVSFLAFFKYRPDFPDALFFSVGVVPIGLSFFFFRVVHIALEWFRGRHTDLSLREFLCYIMFFPTIPAGPIENVDDFYRNRLKKLDKDIISYAVGRIILGTAKKVFLVDFLLWGFLFAYGESLYSNVVLDPSGVSYGTLVLTLFLLLIYSYIDFSAYSDIAIGTGLLFGFRICENFRYPLFSQNISEFWKRYHMSLGAWCRRNVYFPVLMNTRNPHLAIFFAFLTMGLWHHLTVNWSMWALHHSLGVMLIIFLVNSNYFTARFLLSKRLQALWRPIAVLITVFFVTGGTSMVHFEEIDTSFTLYARFFTFDLINI